MKKILAGLLMVGVSSTIVLSDTNFLGFQEGELIKYDSNTVLGDDLFANSNFLNPFGGSLFPKGSSDHPNIYRGITSNNQSESDFYTFYDSKTDNTFVRMGNYNGNLNTSEGTRMSLWYMNNDTGTRENVGNTSYMNVSFQYRFYVDELTRLSLDQDQLILRYQTRNSASNKSGDAYVRDLIINEPGDTTWHTFTTRLSCSETSLTEYCWFWFYYNDIEAHPEQTFYCDIDNISVSLDGGKNVMPGNGTFDDFKSSDTLSITGYNAYNNLYYRPSNGKSAVQSTCDNKTIVRLNSDTNKSNFVVGLDNDIDALRIEFDYKNLSYYNQPDLDLMINGLSGITYENILNSEIVLDNKAVSYKKDLGNDWSKYVIYVDTSSLEKIESVDFVLECDCDLGITNLHINEVKSVDKTVGDYDSFVSYLNNKKSELGDYQKDYVLSSAAEIHKALLKADSINEYSSEDRMIDAKSSIENAVANAKRRGDIEGLRAYLDQLFDEMAGTNRFDYEVKGYVIFSEAVEYAYSLNKNSTYEEVEEAKKRVKEAYENLVRKENA